MNIDANYIVGKMEEMQLNDVEWCIGLMADWLGSGPITLKLRMSMKNGWFDSSLELGVKTDKWHG